MNILRNIWSEMVTDSRRLFSLVADEARRHRVLLVLAVFVLLLATLAILPNDPSLSRRITANRHEPWLKLSSLLRTWGDFRDTVIIFLSLFAGGLLFKRRAWRQAALACFLAACMAGITVNIFRLTTGRPRPKTELPDRLHGPTLNYDLQSFPSGHSGTSTANGIALLVALPGIGIPAVISAGGIVWSSLYSRNHYVSDVLVGSSTGLCFGLLFGLAARRLKNERFDNPGH